MFKEIEQELLSIISEDPIQKIVYSPTVEIAKTLDLLYKIKFDNIKRVYSDKSNDIVNMTVLYEDSKKKTVDHDLCPINGKLHHITFFPVSLLNKDENNAVTLSRSIITYVSCKVALITDKYDTILKRVEDNLFYLTILQSIPVITCAIMRKIYSGHALSKVIYMSLTESLSLYKDMYSEEGIDTILNLFDEGLTVTELLDNGFICSIPIDDSKYPGIWKNNKKEEPSEDNTIKLAEDGEVW